MRRYRHMLAAVVCLAGVALFSTPNEAEDGSCTSATSAEVRDLYGRYADALQRGDVEALTALYSADAILMGPGATSIRLGHAEIAAYYTQFLSHHPHVKVTERVVQTECGSLGDTGIQALTLDQLGGAEQPQTVMSRYAVAYARFGAQWLIVHHRQDLPMNATGSDAPSAGAASSRMITGANPPPPADITVPPAKFALPASPPVILSPTRQLLPVVEVAVPIDIVALDTLLALVPKAPPRLDVTTEHPQPEPRAVTELATEIVFPPPLAPFTLTLQVPPGVSAPEPLAAHPPILPDSDPSTKVAPPAEAPRRADAVREPTEPPAAPAPRTRPASADKLPAQVTQPAAAPVIKPAVAGFTQRVSPPPPAAPPRAAALPPKPVRTEPPARRVQPSSAAAVNPEPAQRPSTQVRAVKPARQMQEAPPAKSGKFLGWEGNRPIFDD